MDPLPGMQSASTPQSPDFRQLAASSPRSPDSDVGRTMTPTVLYVTKKGMPDPSGNPITVPATGGKDGSQSIELNKHTMDALTTLNTALTSAIGSIPTGPQGPKGDKGDPGDPAPAGHGDTVTITYDSPFSTIGVSDMITFLKSPSGTYTEVLVDGLVQSLSSGT